MLAQTGSLLIVGLGLIGSSIARGARAAGVFSRITACDRDQNALRSAIDAGVIDEGAADPAELVAGADLVVLALPVLANAGMLREIASALPSSRHITITDTASVKVPIIDAARGALAEGSAHFIPGHPIAGSERSGYGAGKANLFNRRKVVLTPDDDSCPRCLENTRSLWRLLGADVEILSAQDHDRILAFTSHLPHLLSFALVASLARQDDAAEIFRYAAGGFRDFSRIAASDSRMWQDIFVSNGDAVLAALDEFSADIDHLREAIAGGDGDAMSALFERAREARNRYVSK